MFIVSFCEIAASYLIFDLCFGLITAKANVEVHLESSSHCLIVVLFYDQALGQSAQERSLGYGAEVPVALPHADQHEALLDPGSHRLDEVVLSHSLESNLAGGQIVQLPFLRVVELQ
jgi:hypothetical protein